MIAWFGTDVWALISTDGVICCLNHFVIILDNVWSMKGCAKSHWPLGNIVRIIIGVLPLSLLPWVNFEIVRSFRLEEAVSVCGLSATSDDVMTSSNGNIFRVTGQFVRGIHHAELWCCFYLRLNNRLSKQSCGWWFETLSCPLWRHRNGKPPRLTPSSLPAPRWYANKDTHPPSSPSRWICRVFLFLQHSTALS